MSQIVTSDVEKEDRKETECDGEAAGFLECWVSNQKASTL